MSIIIGKPDSFTVPSTSPIRILFVKVIGRIDFRRLDFEFRLFKSLLFSSCIGLSGMSITEEVLELKTSFNSSFFSLLVLTCEFD